MTRKPSSSPVCYAEDKDIDPSYMWAQPKAKAPAKPKRVARKPTVRSIKK